MRISITKKIIGIVSISILTICLVIGIISSNIMRIIITDEVEMQLKTGAYGVKQTINKMTADDVNKNISDLKGYTNIDITIFEDKTRVASTIKNAVGTKMSNSVYTELVKGTDYFTTSADVNGEDFFGYYIPLINENKLNGAIFAGISTEEVNNTIVTTTIKIIFCILGYGLIFIAIASVIVRKIVKNIDNLKKIIDNIADKDLSAKYEKYSFAHDEIEESYNAIVDTSIGLRYNIENIKGIADNLKEVASELNKSSQFTEETCKEISKAIEDIAHGALSQSEETSNATVKIDSISEDLKKIKSDTNNLQIIANSMKETKDNVINTLDGLRSTNKDIIEDINSVNNQVSITNNNMEEIKKAISIIKGIENQTKLLSLNASIEAARAGEAGKGFKVVADEISILSSQSTQASNEIENILKNLTDNYSLMIEEIKTTSTNMGSQDIKLNETSDKFNNLETYINETIQSINNITIMVENFNTELNDIVDMINNLSAVSEENSAATEETMASIEEMNTIIINVNEKAKNVDNSADKLISEVSAFKTK